MDNQTTPVEFILVGFSEDCNTQLLLFFLFLKIYLLAVTGNMIVFLVTCLDPHLQIPMYFFLGNLAVLDVCYISTIVPKMLSNFITKSNTISYVGCVMQLFFFLFMISTESILLATMAYDRYMAICFPLHYLIIMNRKFCIHLIVGCFLIGSIYSTIHTANTFRITFCGSTINHFFCEIPQLLKLSCSDTTSNELVVFIIGVMEVLICLPCIVISYMHIIKTVLRIPSSTGRQKAFSTCTSHLIAVILFYFACSFAYFRPSTSYSFLQAKISAVFYTIVDPMLNPIIYSLRNRELKDAIKRVNGLRKKNHMRKMG